MENDDKTRIIGRPARPVGGNSSETEDQTRLINRPSGGAPGASSDTTRLSGGLQVSFSDDRTVILGPPTRRKAKTSDEAQGEQVVTNHMQDPVVGWLAVVAGPGAGDYVRLGYGMNNIGRSDDQRCRLNFGDENISRQNHGSVTYDPRGRKFYLQHGGGQNLTYLNEAPVLQPVELSGGEMITLGGTTLRFVPLCGANFDYADIQGGAA
jgi:hypothetical protein